MPQWPSRRRFYGHRTRRELCAFAAAALAYDDFHNALVVHADALRYFRNFCPTPADAVHVYFPDPRWKRRHKNAE